MGWDDSVPGDTMLVVKRQEARRKRLQAAFPNEW